jgi:hypothetical protein
MRLLLDAESREEVLTKGLPRALERVREACRELRRGRVRWERAKTKIQQILTQYSTLKEFTEALYNLARGENKDFRRKRAR